ncbi:MAG: diguanylate cyclase response regulator, partial [Pseudomonadales bacterium]|nr:diguanylate cyclase response regulator [Pseudomonadales bacterium]
MEQLCELDELDNPISILYVEDSTDDILFIEIYLKKVFGAQFTLVAVHSVGEAKRVLYQKCFDLVLLDLSLPDAGGLMGLQSLLVSFPYQAIVVITGMDDVRLGLQAVKLGAQDYLTKGHYTSDTVLRVIRYAVERNRIATQLMKMAHQDPLTGLHNRSGFMNHLKTILPQSQRRNYNIALLYIDLDNFKIINDTLGHEVGDHYLRSISKIFKASTRASDFLARLGGDEFTFIIQFDEHNSEEPLTVAQNVIKALEHPIKIGDGQSIRGACSIGIALWDHSVGSGTAADWQNHSLELINRADTAMYQAKQVNGSSYQFYDEALAHKATEKQAFLRGLRNAQQQGEF